MKKLLGDVDYTLLVFFAVTNLVHLYPIFLADKSGLVQLDEAGIIPMTQRSKTCIASLSVNLGR